MADSNGSEQVEILRGIWNEMKALRAEFGGRIAELGGRIDLTNTQLGAVRTEISARLDQTNLRLDSVRTELKGELDALRRQMVEGDMRLATVVTELAGDVRDLSGVIRDWRADHRAEVAALRERVERLVKNAGLPQGE